MIPKNALITNYLAREYKVLLEGATLVRVEYLKKEKLFRYLLSTDHKYSLLFSFAPPNFVLLNGWDKVPDSFEIWPECANSVIGDIYGSDENRMISFSLTHTDDSGSRTSFKIIFELFGALSNAYLLNEGNTILHATRVVNDPRKLRPMDKYLPPQPLEKHPAKESYLLGRVGEISYHLIRDNEDYHIESKPDDGLKLSRSTPLVTIYQKLFLNKATVTDIDDLRDQAAVKLRRALKKQNEMLKQLQNDLAEAQNAERYTQLGDILMANPHLKAEKGALTLFDFYSEKEINIQIPPGKSVMETATSYYKLGKKLKRAPAMLAPRIEKIERSVTLVKESLDQLKSLTESSEIRRLLTRAGAEKSQAPPGTKPAESESTPDYRVLRSTSGEKILIGKTAKGNDVLTFKVARSYDIWFHAQQAPGSHVVLVVLDKNQIPSRKSITEAAQAAAHYSDLRKSKNVPVMYTEKRHVRKAKDGAPGKVVVQQFKSIFVKPSLPTAGINNSGILRGKE